MASPTPPTDAPKTPQVPWRIMFEDSTLGIARADLEGKFVEANRAYCELVGYSNDELRTVTLLDLAAEDDRHANAQLVEQLRRGERHDFQIETRYRRKDGQTIWVHNTVSVISGTDEWPSFIMIITKDITARKNADEKLRKQNDALQRIFEHVPVMISFTAKDGSIDLVNREWERTLG